MAPTKLILLIHGRATKPDEAEKTRLVMRSLTEGLDRVDPQAADALRSGAVEARLAYYGDINNDLILAVEPHRRRHMVQDDQGRWFEPPGSYDADLDRLLARPTNRHTAADYRELLAQERDRRYMDDAARVLSALGTVFGFGRRLVMSHTPDLAQYLLSRRWGSAIRTRLQQHLRPALLERRDVALVAHSMGCIVSYDVLWKFSHMSEYAALHDRRVALWLTLGSPLGEPVVQDEVYDADEPADGRYPRNVERWVNVAAHDDFVAHDGTVADDFAPMLRAGCVGSIEDRPRIHTFWAGTDGTNPHKFYGYLNHPDVAATLAEWVRAP